MPSYTAPTKDLQFVLHDVLKVTESKTPGYDELEPDFTSAILEEAGKLTSEVLAPLNAVGDQEGCRLENGVVYTPKGFKEAFEKVKEGGWTGLDMPEEYGGQNMPYVLGTAVGEMFSAANQAFTMYQGLTHGAASAILAHGTDAQKDTYLPKMVSCEWTGTMNLTEPHCGTDLGLMRTKAAPQDDGSYKISGQKIFISSGEHDMADNIVHIVLARLPDAPQGTKGISLFIVPKFLPNAEGGVGERNGVSCGSLEHKMGIHGNATCVMNFDAATGFLIGPPNKGLNCMFTFMNTARLGTALQGLAHAEIGFQGGIKYARERLQMRSLTGPKAPEKAADPIIVHPDVRRMLLTMKALNEGGRAFSSYVALQLDIAKFSDDAEARQRAEAQVALLTPVAKAFLTDMGLETTVHGQQVFGGHGFIREWGQEQLVRDCRITQIYEGTNGIQALDLLGRKVVGSGGELYSAFAEEIRGFCAAAGSELEEFTAPLKAALENLDALTASVIDSAKRNPNEIGAASVEYLHVFGYTAYAYMWARMAEAALGKEAQDDFYASKLGTARFYFARLLPRIHSLSATVRAGSESLYLLDAAQF